MESSDVLRPLSPAVAATQAFVDSVGGAGFIIGGLAVGLIARARSTKDVDATIIADSDDIESLLSGARRFGLVPRPGYDTTFGRQQRLLLLVHEPTKIGVDISLGALPFEIEAAERSRTVELDGRPVRVATPEDLVIMKALAHRLQDLADIRLIVEVNPDLDRKRIERWVKDFAETLEMPELWDEIVPLLAMP